MPEGGHREALPTRLVEHPVEIALVLPVRPALHHVPQVDDESVLNGGNGDPLFRGGVIDLKTMLSGVLQQDGEASVVGVRTGAEDPGVSEGVFGVAEEFEEPGHG